MSSDLIYITPCQARYSQSPLDRDPETDGIQVFAGETVPLFISLSDDVQVIRAEVLLNGQIVSSGTAWPFNLQIPVPAWSESAPPLQIQLRAFDSGGNIGLSEMLEWTIVPVGAVVSPK